MLRFGIIGCGLIGQKRANAIYQLGDKARLVACNDIDFKKAQFLANSYDTISIYKSWHQLIEDKSIDVVLISTLHDSLAEISYQSIKKGKHVFVEKPAGRNFSELIPVIDLANSKSCKVRVGFNHRYHRTFQKAKKILEEESFGKLMFIRARYGHGARLGYEKEWRADPKLSGGGELIDQGPHLIDLARWLFGTELEYSSSSINSYFWEMPVEDNAFLILKTKASQVAFLHVSCTEWKNTFSFEIYGKRGKLVIDGLGGSYGVERLTHYKMLPQMGPPETYIYEFPMADNSWVLELKEFCDDIIQDREVECGLKDALEVLKIIEKAYEDNKSGN